MDLILSYDPKPIDNSPIELSPELRSLVEMLARNNHDLWARGRMADGWKLGSRRDDERKETPLLVPYEDLPDFEKEYDRQNAVETLKTIFKLGGKIEMPPAAAGEEYEKYRTQGKKANQQGQALVAFDLADRGLKFWPRDCELLQIQALALARMGSTERAREILESLPVDPGDQETPGILARTYKDIWLRTGNAADLRKAIEQYLAAYRGDVARYWTGINAATLLWAEGKRDEAARIAKVIFRHCVELIPHAELKDRYWIVATAAEAALLAGDLDAAERFYAEAREAGEGNIGEIFSTWRNARIVLQQLPADAANRIASVFRLPHVAVFAGDGELTREDLARMNIGVGFAAAASNADIAFLEAVHERGGKTHLVLPCEPDELVKSMSPQHSARFTAAVKRADEVIVTRDERGVFGSVAVRYANDVTEGLAAVRAAQYETELHRIGTRAELTDELITGKGTKPRLCSMLFADVKHFGALKDEQVPRFLREFFAPIGAAASSQSRCRCSGTRGEMDSFSCSRMRLKLLNSPCDCSGARRRSIWRLRVCPPTWGCALAYMPVRCLNFEMKFWDGGITPDLM